MLAHRPTFMGDEKLDHAQLAMVPKREPLVENVVLPVLGAGIERSRVDYRISEDELPALAEPPLDVNNHCALVAMLVSKMTESSRHFVGLMLLSVWTRILEAVIVVHFRNFPGTYSSMKYS